MTPEQLQAATGCTAANALKYAAPLTVGIQRWGVGHVAQFIGQIVVESANFTAVVENLNYSAQGLANTWSRFSVTGRRGGPPNALAQSLARKPEQIANEVYAGRMGNTRPGDGWLRRGRGLKQLTGHDNHRAYQDASGVPVIAHPELLEQPTHAADSACWFWSSNKCDDIATDILALTRRINGGALGLAEREAATTRARAVL